MTIDQQLPPVGHNQIPTFDCAPFLNALESAGDDAPNAYDALFWKGLVEPQRTASNDVHFKIKPEFMDRIKSVVANDDSNHWFKLMWASIKVEAEDSYEPVQGVEPQKVGQDTLKSLLDASIEEPALKFRVLIQYGRSLLKEYMFLKNTGHLEQAKEVLMKAKAEMGIYHDFLVQMANTTHHPAYATLVGCMFYRGYLQAYTPLETQQQELMPLDEHDETLENHNTEVNDASHLLGDEHNLENATVEEDLSVRWGRAWAEHFLRKGAAQIDYVSNDGDTGDMAAQLFLAFLCIDDGRHEEAQSWLQRAQDQGYVLAKNFFQRVNEEKSKLGTGDDRQTLPDGSVYSVLLTNSEWAIYNGEMMLDEKGNKVPVVATDNPVPSSKVEEPGFFARGVNALCRFFASLCYSGRPDKILKEEQKKIESSKEVEHEVNPTDTLNSLINYVDSNGDTYVAPGMPMDVNVYATMPLPSAPLPVDQAVYQPAYYTFSGTDGGTFEDLYVTKN